VRPYRWLLRLFPAAFRGRFGGDMTDVFADRLRRARAEGRAAVARLWVRTTADLVAHGLAERRAARRRRRRTSMLNGWTQDVTFGWRTLRRAPAITALAVMTLALGIGAATAVFSVADALVLRALPYPHANRLFALTDVNTERGHDVNVALPNFDDWRASVDAIDAAAAWQTADVNLAGASGADRVSGARVAGDFFDIVGAAPIVGRTFGPEPPAPGTETVAVLSEGAWRRTFGARQDIAGTTAMLDGLPHEILGVVPAIPGLATVDVWRPIARTASAASRRSHAFRVIARLRPGVTMDHARAQFDVVAARLAAAYPESNAGWRVGVTPLQETLGEDLDQVLVLVSGVAGVLLLIACTNVAGLLVARAADRRREFAVRTALGAPRRRLVRQLAIESVLLSLAAAGGGLVLATWATGLIVGVLPADVVPWRDPSLSLPVLAFAIAVSVATGVLFGLAPAVTMLGLNTQARLRDSAVATSAGTRRLRHGLVFVQVALASVLLVGAGLLLASLWRAVRVDPGIDPQSVLTFSVTPPRSTHADAEALVQYFDDMLARLAALPQVETAGAISSLPMADNETISTIRRPDEPAPAPGRERWALHQVSTPGYMRASGTRLLAGRDFTDTDTAGSDRVVIVNESLARELWPDGGAVGRDLILEPTTPYRVVGLIADVRHFGLDQKLYAQYFVPLRQSPVRSLGVALRLRGGLAPDVLRQTLASIDPTVPLYDLRTFDAIVSGSLASRRGLAAVVVASSAAAGLLAVVGLFGVVATGVRDRRREIGIRMALGASGARVVALFVRRAALLAGGALVAGLIASYWSTGLLEEFLFGVERLDAVTIALVSVTVLCVAMFASWLSARQAARVDPIEVLRTE
jgi:predicted permease